MNQLALNLGLTPQLFYTMLFLIVILILTVNAVIILKVRDRAARKKKTPVTAAAVSETPQLRVTLNKKINELLLKTKNIDDAFLDSLEELLYTSDLGPSTVELLLTKIREKLSRGELKDIQKIKSALTEEMTLILTRSQKLLQIVPKPPVVILIVGVNGVGKTTSIGKLSYYFKQKGKSVLIVAADTFRAAAQDQLQVWAERSGADFYTTTQTQDPAAVAFQGLQKAVSENKDVVIIDTAGRLHNKENLMEELKKVKRVLQKISTEAPHQVLLVIDGNSGQNALQQAKLFNEAVEITGLIVTKLDGSAKGGVIVGISNELGINPQYIGLGEKMTDFQEFNPTEFAKSLLKD